MRDLESPRAIYAKGALFLVLGVVAALLLVLENPTLKTGLLLAIAVWSFCKGLYPEREWQETLGAAGVQRRAPDTIW